LLWEKSKLLLVFPNYLNAYVAFARKNLRNGEKYMIKEILKQTVQQNRLRNKKYNNIFV